jgi:16S rRNA (uracil1498-N3)-methyltransferase
MITVLARPGSLVAGATVTLEAEEEHHLAVRRAAPDAPVRLLDGAGAEASGRLALEGRRVTVRVEAVAREPAPVPTILAVGAGDRDRFGWLVEQAAQLGATGVVPLETARTASVATRLRPAHLERVRRRARDAIKQCGSAWAPVVADPVPLPQFLASPPEGARWLAEEEGKQFPGLGQTDAVTIAVGPEGGFTAEERSALKAAGFAPVRLGPNRLRFETAALAALTTAWLARQRGGHG